jgi:hypothetical protein
LFKKNFLYLSKGRPFFYKSSKFLILMPLGIFCLLLSLCVGAGRVAIAQDIITRTDGVTIEASILQISTTQIEYKKFNQPEGPVYLISLSDVHRVEGADGIKRTFAPADASALPLPAYNYEQNWKTHMLLLNFSSLISSIISLNYEHVFPSGKASIRVPVNIRIPRDDEFGTSLEDRGASGLGINLNFFPHGQGRFRSYWGPAVAVGYFRYTSYSPAGYSLLKNGTMLILKGQIGVYYQLSASIITSVETGLGFRTVQYRADQSYSPRSEYNRVIVPFNILAGFRL